MGYKMIRFILNLFRKKRFIDEKSKLKYVFLNITKD